MELSRGYGIKGRLGMLSAVPLALFVLSAWLTIPRKTSSPPTPLTPVAEATSPEASASWNALREILHRAPTLLTQAYLEEPRSQARLNTLKQLDESIEQFEKTQEVLKSKLDPSTIQPLLNQWTLTRASFDENAQALRRRLPEYDIQVRHELLGRVPEHIHQTNTVIESLAEVHSPKAVHSALTPQAPLLDESKILKPVRITVLIGAGLSLLLGVGIFLNVSRGLKSALSGLSSSSVELTGASTRLLQLERSEHAASKAKEESMEALQLLSDEIDHQFRQVHQVMEKLSHQLKDNSLNRSAGVEVLISELNEIHFQSDRLLSDVAAERTRSGESNRGVEVLIESLKALSERSGTKAKSLGDTLLKHQWQDARELCSELRNSATELQKKMSDLTAAFTKTQSNHHHESQVALELRESQKRLAHQGLALHQIAKRLTVSLNGNVKPLKLVKVTTQREPTIGDLSKPNRARIKLIG